MRTTTQMPPLEKDPSLLLAEAVATNIKWNLTLHLRNFLHPLFGHKHSYTSIAFVVPGPVDLYLESLPLIVRQLPPQCMVSWIQQISTFLWDSVSNTTPTLPLRAFTLSVPTLNFLRCLLDSPHWPAVPHPTMHFPTSSACTTYMAIPISHGIRNSNPRILAVTAPSWSKNRDVLNHITRPLCGAVTHRIVSTCWPAISFTKKILSETLHLENFPYPLFGHKHS